MALHPRRRAYAAMALVWLLAGTLAAAPAAAQLIMFAAQASAPDEPCPHHQESAGDILHEGSPAPSRTADRFHACGGNCCGLLCHTQMQGIAGPDQTVPPFGRRWHAAADLRPTGIEPQLPPRPPKSGSSA